MNNDQMQEWVARSRRDHARGQLSPEVMHGVEEASREIQRQWSQLAAMRARQRYGGDVDQPRAPISRFFISVRMGERESCTESFALPIAPNSLDLVRLDDGGSALSVCVSEVFYQVFPDSISRVFELSTAVETEEEFVAASQKAWAIAAFFMKREAQS